MDLLLLSYAGVTAKEFLALRNHEYIKPDLSKKLAYAKSLNREEILGKLQSSNVDFITYKHSKYPQLLKEIYDFPYIIYYRGNINLLQTDMLGVVGSRKATLYTKNALLDILPKLKGITIISGLAYGADEMAHSITIKSDLKTIGVLAFGHDIHYPKTTEKVRALMEKEHLTISEYPPGTKIEKWRFIARNRIISGCAKGVLVTEAEEKSGSLITLEMALDENRNGYCLPGNITSDFSRGTNLRIKDGAMLVLSADDILLDYI